VIAEKEIIGIYIIKLFLARHKIRSKRNIFRKLEKDAS
jgi:hypothetical protein